MIFARRNSFKYRGVFATILLCGMGLLSSCDSLIYDDQGDCSVHYKLSFRYTKNLLQTDAFASQVTDVNVAIYDKSGAMVYKKSERRNLTAENTYNMDIDILPGKYDIIAWCEGESAVESSSSFILEGQTIGDDIRQSGAHLPLLGTAGRNYFDRDLNRLYYGQLTDVDFVNSYGEVNIEPIYLTRDTNNIFIQLQNMSGQPLDPAQLSFELEAIDSSLDWLNNPVDARSFTYYPWLVQSTFSDPVPDTKVTVEDSNINNGVQAAISIGRLMAEREQKLTVKLKSTGDEILSFPLIQYLLLVKDFYPQFKTNQDYLDCFENHTLVFFIDEGYVWNKTRIFINNWRRVPPQSGGIDYSA